MCMNLIKSLFLILFINVYVINCVCIAGENCPYNQGYCMNDSCVCLSNYWTHNKINNSPIIYCNYQRTSSLKLFIAEFFLPPLGNYLAGYYFYATFKLVLIIIFLIFVKSGVYAEFKDAKIFLLFLLISLLTLLIMQICDIFGYLIGYYTDSEGVPLY